MMIVDVQSDDFAPDPEEDVAEMLHMLVHDVNNITHAINGYTNLLKMAMADEKSPDRELMARAVEVILNRTDELTRLMKETADYNRRLHGDF